MNLQSFTTNAFLLTFRIYIKDKKGKFLEHTMSQFGKNSSWRRIAHVFQKKITIFTHAHMFFVAKLHIMWGLIKSPKARVFYVPEIFRTHKVVPLPPPSSWPFIVCVLVLIIQCSIFFRRWDLVSQWSFHTRIVPLRSHCHFQGDSFRQS